VYRKRRPKAALSRATPHRIARQPDPTADSAGAAYSVTTRRKGRAPRAPFTGLQHSAVVRACASPANGRALGEHVAGDEDPLESVAGTFGHWVNRSPEDL
jgi:hypothetical protein